MRVRRIAALLGSAALVAVGLSAPVSASPPGELAPGAHPAANVHASDRVVYNYDRSENAARAGGARPGGSPNMTSHGGPVLTTSTTTGAIFWGPSWASNPGDKITGMDSWYGGFGGSNYAKTTVEYTDSTGSVSPATSYAGHWVDTSAPAGGSSTGAILAEVAKVVTNPVRNGYYAVYTDLPRGHAKYCAWHSAGTIGASALPVEFAFFWKLDGDPGCNPGDTTAGRSEGLAAIANVSGHELAEAMTDPRLDAWYDAQGSENGDKCAWTFNTSTVHFPNGTDWRIQGEWSNAAYNNGTGYANSSGQKGCVPGA